MADEFLDKAADLRARGETFAIAQVVRFEAPISGKPGDKALILASGKISGWIGGGCTQPVVVKEALKAIEDGQPRLVRITPEGHVHAEPGILEYPMTCHSGGTLDIYIEPVLPRRQIVIFGRSAVAQYLVRLAKAVNYSITIVSPEAAAEDFPVADAVRERLDAADIRRPAATWVVVSTQGEDDEGALEQALAAGTSYVAFVASRRKAAKAFQYLRGKGISEEALRRVKTPAGMDIGAVAPEEIAVSILAEIVQAARGRLQTSPPPEEAKASPFALVASEAKDPVCGMMVNIARAKYRSEHRDATYYFCCARCKEEFDRNPDVPR